MESADPAQRPDPAVAGRSCPSSGRRDSGDPGCAPCQPDLLVPWETRPLAGTPGRLGRLRPTASGLRS